MQSLHWVRQTQKKSFINYYNTISRNPEYIYWINDVTNKLTTQPFNDWYYERNGGIINYMYNLATNNNIWKIGSGLTSTLTLFSLGANILNVLVFIILF